MPNIQTESFKNFHLKLGKIKVRRTLQILSTEAFKKRFQQDYNQCYFVFRAKKLVTARSKKITVKVAYLCNLKRNFVNLTFKIRDKKTLWGGGY